MRRFSFKIDLSQKGKSESQDSATEGSPAPADGFVMSSELGDEDGYQSEWPRLQRELFKLPQLNATLEDWSNPNLAAEYIRVYNVSQERVTQANTGFDRQEKSESHCFFEPDGTKFLVSRLYSKVEERISEIRLSPDGQLVRLSYEKSGEGPLQNLDDLFRNGLYGVDQDSERFGAFPHYVLRFFLFKTKGRLLASSFRGVCYFDHELGNIVTEEAAQIA